MTNKDTFCFKTSAGELVYSNAPEYSDEAVKKGPRGKSRSSAKDCKAVVFNIFYDMKQYCVNDPYWYNRLTSWSEGKVCNKYRYFPENKILRFSKTGNTKLKKHELKLDPDDLQGSLQMIKDFMSIHSAEASEMDILQCRVREQKAHFVVQNKATNNRNLFNKAEDSRKIIFDYVLEKYPNIDGEERDSMIDSIVLLILSNNMSSITVTDNKLTDVTGIGIDKKTGLYYPILEKVKQIKNTGMDKDDLDDDECETVKSQMGGAEDTGDIARFRIFMSKYQKTFMGATN